MYHVVRPIPPVAGLGLGTDPTPMSTGTKVVLGVVLVGIAGFVVWSAKRRYEIMEQVAKKEGGSGVMKMQAGEAAVGLSHALGSFAARRNPRRWPRLRRGVRR